MNNLTTRKIVLGLLMTLVLAFSVQGIADAATITLTGSGTSADLNWRDIGEEITVSITGIANLDTTVESVTFSVSNGATFDLSNPPDARSTHTWQETGVGTGAFQSTIAGSSAAISSSVTFTVPTAGEVTATLSATGATTQYLTFYVVKDRFIVTATDTVGLDNITNGVGGRYSGNVKIHSGDGRNNPVTYNVTGTNATLYIQKGTDTTRRLTPLANNGRTSSNADVWLDMGPNTSSTVTAWVTNGGRRTQGVYIHGNPSLKVTTLPTPTFSGPPDSVSHDVDGTATPNTITVTVYDQTIAGITGTTAVANAPVKFDASATGGYLIPSSMDDGNGFSTTIVDSGNNPIMHTAVPALAQTLYVRTSGGTSTASVGFQFGTIPGKSEIQVSISGRNFTTVTKKVEATVTGTGTTTLTIDNPNTGRLGDSKRFELVALVERNGETVRGLSVTFRTSHGLLTNTPTGDTPITNPDGGDVVKDNSAPQVEKTQVMDITDRLGKARVFYDLDGNTGRQEIDAIIYEGDPKDKRQVTFVVNGPAGSGGGGGTPVNRLAITPTSISGAPDATRAITVTALNTSNVSVSNVSVTLGGLTSFLADGGTLSSTAGVTPFTSTLTLPDTAATHLITAFATGYTSVSTLVTVTAAVAPGPLSITTVGDPVNGQQTIEVSVRNADGTAPSGAVPVTLTGPGISRTVDTLRGTGRAIITLPTATVSYVLTVSATGYTSGSVTLTPSGQTTTRGAAGEADSVEIDGSRQLSGTVDQAMRLRVRVLDANDNGVSDVRVTFRVLAPGRGTFAGARGNGRATQDQTDRNGYASANLTPSDDGDIIVRASAAGVSADVTFIIDVGEAADDDDTETPTPSRDVAPSRDISPVVHLGAASRPPMLWVDGGAIYALVGASPQRFAASVDNALNITVAGGKVYWTEQTGESSGTINSANLNGSGVTELASIMAVPMGIAVDTAGSKLYWTNSRGRIQSANLDGSRITNELQNLPSPMDIALGRGLVYWTQGNGSVRLVNLTGQKIVRDISTGSDTPGSLVIGGSKVYWTEQTGDGSGTINSANLSGTGATQLASILAVPSGIAVDGSRSKLYWTNSRGRIQSADLDGSKIQNVVSGLGSPGDMVLSNSITAPAAAPAETASGSKYDVNGDGTVDNADSDAVTVAIAAGATDAKYDVNGDGTVNVFDLVEIIANRDPGAAGAPTLFGMKMSAAQIDSLQEQIDLLIATNDRSPAAMRTLIYLQQLLVTARPEKTLLLANYPNPFNPETWIPYELATDTDVRLTIYNTQGVVIRSLEFGHQSAGYYTGRDRAAYWDGRNALGERVASGMYFYQLETDEMSLMRKMVILK